AAATTLNILSLTASPLSVIPAAPSALPVSVPVAARALPALSAAVDGLTASPENSRHSRVGADSPAGSYGRVLFDGSGRLVSHHGAVFVPTSRTHPAVRGAVTLVQSGLGPKATVRPVSGTEGLSGQELLDKVGQIAAKNQKTNEYHAASQYIFKTADHVVVGGVSGVVDAYSGTFVPGDSGNGADYPEAGDQDGDGYHERDGMNIEHTWPQSLFNRSLPMRADIHHLMATFKHPNGMREALPFGEVKGTPDYSNNAGAKSGGGYFEPPDITKGRVARNLLYFYARYKNSSFMNGRSARFWNVQIGTMLRWNRQFPPDTQEMRRNDLVEQYQGNRNPFVDDPGLADRIGADALKTGRNPAMARMSLAPRSDVSRGGKHRHSLRRGGSSRFAPR
ncbi:MAG: endonuclease, partial [Elusimicrobiota bacterium]